jgi:hypothetical protein
LCISLLVSAPSLGADESAPTFDLHTADCVTTSGSLRELGADWAMRLQGGQARRVNGAAIVSLRRRGVPLPARPGPGTRQLLLANGSRIPGTVLKIANDRLLFRPLPPVRPENDGEWELPLSMVSAVWQGSPSGTADPRAVLRRLAGEARTRDVLLLRDGDRIEGTFKGLVRGAFRIEPEGKQAVEVRQELVAALAFNSELVSRARPRGISGHLILTGGGRLVLVSARLGANGETLRGRLPGGVSFTVPLADVAALDLRQGCAVYLSDLKPLAYQHTPFFGVRWPYVLDANVANRALRLGGSVYDKGVGMHSRSRLTYDLRAGFRRFEALVGLDERTGRGGLARIQVLVDGKPVPLGRDGELSGRDKPKSLRVDVSKGRELTLVVDFGRFGDVQGHVNWADARLIK